MPSHREAILALTRPELEAISNSRSAERFSGLRDRLEEAVQAARDSRESVVGSFDVLITSTSHRTNEIMKVLTLASVLLLPGALIAGVMGMNFRVGLFEHTMLFWVMIGTMLAVAFVTLGVARMRDWI
ncbi:MAG TPA: CorA family divalent cation transporter [Gaiellaceae bacterium]|nr:CorA family divalent cation transporter [Gaiellaceae bacterium]